MSDRLLQLAVEEEKALLDELRQHPTFAKLEAVRSLLAAYEATSKPIRSGYVRLPSVGSQQLGGSMDKPKSLTALVSDAGENFLGRLGRRATVTEIMDDPNVQELMAGRDKPIPYLSSVLSHDNRFNNVRGKGYGLKIWNDGDGPNAPSSSTPQTTPQFSGAPSPYQGLNVNSVHGFGAPHTVASQQTGHTLLSSHSEEAENDTMTKEEAMHSPRNSPLL